MLDQQQLIVVTNNKGNWREEAVVNENVSHDKDCVIHSIGP
jgi:hypothetical protein